MNSLILRDASESDAPIIAELVYVTEDDPEHEWGEGSKEEILQRIISLINTDGSRYYYKNIKVAELEGKPCGAIILLNSDDILKLDIKTSGKLFISIKGFIRKIKFIKDFILSLRLDECDEHELYIANIATSKDMRGRGIGKALMELADEMAKKEGYAKCSLLAKDESLIRFYSKFNYKFERVENYFSHNLYRMVKAV